jgi:hypothetical protein
MMDRETQRQFDRLREQVEIMVGERGSADKAKTAVRRGELRPLASLKLKSSQISAAPTQDDYNRLQADVEAVYGAFVLISNLLGNAKIPKI